MEEYYGVVYLFALLKDSKKTNKRKKRKKKKEKLKFIQKKIIVDVKLIKDQIHLKV